jgi:serine protease Do
MRATAATFLALCSFAAAPAAEPTRPELLLALEKQLKAAGESAGPAVACVVVSRSDRYPKLADEETPGRLGGFDRNDFLKTHPDQKRLALALDLSDPLTIADHGYACGVVIDAAGLVLTPYHVVEGATKIFVHLPGRAGSYADVRAADSRSDLAVLKLLNPPAGLVPIKFGEARLQAQRGKPANVFAGKFTVLVASGYLPGFALDKPSAALGSVAKVYQPANPQGAGTSDSYYHFGPLVAHDARLNAGADGAALLNLDGEMVGLATSSPAVVGSQGPHFAFPCDEYFRNVVEVLRRGEEVEYGYLGVMGPQPEPTQNPVGIGFQLVMPGGPAARAGMEPGDILTHVDGLPTHSYEQLLLRIGSALAGSKVRVAVLRDGRRREIDVVLGKFAHKQPYIASVRPEPVFGLRVDYGSVLAQAQRDPRGPGRGVPPGVSVREVAPDSPAARALGERPERWVITRVNGQAVTTPAEFYKAARGQKSIKLTLQDPTDRNPTDREVTVP